MHLPPAEKNGFGLIELVILVSTLAVVLSIAIPNFRSLKTESSMAKVEEDLSTLKTALLTYWKSNHQSYPQDIYSELINTNPAVITEPLRDPWRTDKSHRTYGYLASTDPNFGNYFIVYTKGPGGDTNPVFNAAKQRVEYSGSGKVVSNAPTKKN